VAKLSNCVDECQQLKGNESNGESSSIAFAITVCKASRKQKAVLRAGNRSDEGVGPHLVAGQALR